MHRLEVIEVDERRQRVTLCSDFLMWLVTKSQRSKTRDVWQSEAILQEYTYGAFTTYELPDAIKVLEVILRDMAKHVGLSNTRRLDTP
jgi:hypothetical protein